MTEEQKILVNENMKLIYSIANRIKSSLKLTTFDYEDLVNIGVVALIKAATTFKDDRNVKFSSYAYIIIKRDMVFEINKDVVRLGVPKHLLELIPRLKAEINWRELNEKEVSERLNIPEKRAISLLIVANNQTKWSMEKQVSEDNELGELLGKESDFGMVFVRDFLSTLDGKDQEIVKAKLLGYKQKEIAKKYSSTPQMVNQRFRLKIRPMAKQYYAEV
ncbi:sigma-70 family RNA polymerase sigma factor [Shouchella miscanthi]|uniref:sigma-70 family RNA polymerase sigma factor n=1 Tax=Shouchella miscanthi TaxID=2598861 RepID=UPI00119CDFCF|nr:sigma-70 family RNA polymerase sigma factor [Shouchella miscanthi]